MNNRLNQPNSFTQILDLTFRIGKDHFRNFFYILFVFMGPIFLLQALLELQFGLNLINFGTDDANANFVDRMISRFDSGFYDDGLYGLELYGTEIVTIIVALATIILAPISTAAIVIAIDKIRKNEPYTVGSVIKEAFRRFFPLMGGSIVFGLIITFVSIISILLVVLAIYVAGGFDGNIIATVLIIIFSTIVGIVGLGYFFTRISFYITAIAVGEKSPAIVTSFRLSKGRGWILLGLIVVISMITSTISGAFEVLFTLIFGASVLLSLSVNLISIVTSMFMTIAYAVMYFDMKARRDGDDLDRLLDEYEQQ